ncbi:hypothetical protein KFE25_001998 [Diacronema lutheri]|uniref:protein-disulfide reductase n=2 Tax=Diacronema lutheri TaxID=2081491 RepID=A0A8J5XKU8_DIALT|nr:hypothetical protein KFE25_001998 [Diacronema lutheri]
MAASAASVLASGMRAFGAFRRLTCALGARPLVRRLLKPLGTAALACTVAAELSRSALTFSDDGARQGADAHSGALATERLVVWLAHARARAESLLCDPPMALRRFGDSWRALVGPELEREVGASRRALETALGAVSSPGGGAALEQLEELASAINAAEETMRKARITAAASASRFSWLELMRDVRIHRLDGSGGSAGEVPAETLLGKIVLLYFTAGWCPPCREFTPRLAAAAEALGEGCEVVQVSWDHDELAMQKYARALGMRWLAISHEQRALARELSSRYDVEQIPALVVIAVSPDGASTRVLSSDGRMDVLRFLAQPQRGGDGDGSSSQPPLAAWIRRLLDEAPQRRP